MDSLIVFRLNPVAALLVILRSMLFLCRRKSPQNRHDSSGDKFHATNTIVEEVTYFFQRDWIYFRICANNTHHIPDINIESEIDVSVLMMVIMENSIGLPWLPPLRFECDARVTDNSVIICVQQNSIKKNLISNESIISINICEYSICSATVCIELTPMNGHEDNWRCQN